MVEHRGCAIWLWLRSRPFLVESASRILQFSSFSFDACASEFVMTLCRGAVLILPPPKSIMAGAVLIETLAAHDVTHATLPPAVLASLPEDTGSDRGLVQSLIVAGEAPTAEMVKRWGEKRRFINAYGPTETSVCATTHECRTEEQGNPPIGRPIANTQIYILDASAAARADRGGGRDPHRRGGRGARLPEPAGADGGAVRGGPVQRRRRCAAVQDRRSRPLAAPTATSSFWAATTSRSRSAASASSWARSRRALGAASGVREAVVLAREDTPGDKRLVAYVRRGARRGRGAGAGGACARTCAQRCPSTWCRRPLCGSRRCR